MIEKGIIYKVTSKTSGKFYIGKTKRTLEERKKEHFYDSKKLISKFYKAINKYGFNDFIWKEIEINIPLKELNKKEIYWIKKLHAIKEGYNILKGGSGCLGLIHSDITRKHLSKILSGKNNHNYGKKLDKKILDKNKTNQPFRKDIKINNINYVSIRSAAKILKLSISTVRNRLKNKNYPNYEILKERKINNKIFKIKVDDNIFNSKTEATRMLKISMTTLDRRLNNRRYTNYKILKITNYDIKGRKDCKPLSVNNKKFYSIGSAVKELGMSSTTIRERCLSENFPNYCFLNKSEKAKN